VFLVGTPVRIEVLVLNSPNTGNTFQGTIFVVSIGEHMVGLIGST
jgi:hypothetical protein